MNFYLSPKDYHRYHAPCDFKLLKLIHVPGKLYPVNLKYLKKEFELFVQNERVILECERDGKIFYMVFVGALNVGQMVFEFENRVETNTNVKERTYLPGYVLVEAALVGEVAHHLRNTPNVIGFLGGLDHPVPLRQSEVNRILGTVDELQESGEDLNIPYTVGETVKVSVGPFSGFSGLIEEVNAEKRKLKVMVKIFGRKTPLELGFTDVEKE
jgi:transcription antitermination factor NusG